MKFCANHYFLLLIFALLLPSCMGGPGGTEILIIGGIILLLFGGSKLPKLMRGLGSGVTEFKKGLKEGEPGDALESEEVESEEDKDASV